MMSFRQKSFVTVETTLLKSVPHSHVVKSAGCSNIKLFAERYKSIEQDESGGNQSLPRNIERSLACKLAETTKHMRRNGNAFWGTMRVKECLEACELDASYQVSKLCPVDFSTFPYFSLSLVTEFHVVIRANHTNLYTIGWSHAWNSIISGETRGWLE